MHGTRCRGDREEFSCRYHRRRNVEIRADVTAIKWDPRALLVRAPHLEVPVMVREKVEGAQRPLDLNIIQQNVVHLCFENVTESDQ